MFGFAKFCRLCLDNSNPLVNMSKTDSYSITYCDKIKDFMPELVAGRYKSFPPWICNLCSEEINKYFLFRQKCLGTHELLKTYRKQLKSLKVDYTPINPTTRSSWDDSERPPRNHSEHSCNNNSEPIVKTNESFEASHNDNSSDTNISIVKNEIPVTEEDEFSFKLFYKTLLKPETETSATNQLNDNIAKNDNINENEVEIKEKIISVGTNNINAVRSEQTNQQIIIEEVASQAPQNRLKQGVIEKPQNIPANLEKTKNPSKIAKTVSSGKHGNKKSRNNPSLLLNKDSEQSSSENTALPSLNLRKRRRSSITYNERSDNEDDSDFVPEKVDNSNCIKKLKHNHEDKNKEDSTKTVIENTIPSDVNIKDLTQTEKQINLNEKFKFKIYTSNNVSKVISINKSKCKNIGSRSELGADSLNIKNTNKPIFCEKVKENISKIQTNTEPKKIIQIDAESNKNK